MREPRWAAVDFQSVTPSVVVLCWEISIRAAPPPGDRVRGSGNVGAAPLEAAATTPAAAAAATLTPLDRNGESTPRAVTACGIPRRKDFGDRGGTAGGSTLATCGE